MKKTTVIYKQYDVVVVPFPFTDSATAKRRPAIILSDKNFNDEAGHSVMAMITSARNNPWPGDVVITDLATSGLPKRSVIRMKFFTIDHKLIIKTSGTLSKRDKVALQKIIKSILKV